MGCCASKKDKEETWIEEINGKKYRVTASKQIDLMEGFTPVMSPGLDNRAEDPTKAPPPETLDDARFVGMRQSYGEASFLDNEYDSRNKEMTEAEKKARKKHKKKVDRYIQEEQG
eukprot:GFYU01049421.1.p1 GENE.GFYU01049421.1~~GFYU01049421.1.p1  ORF type:complete len:115 (-),score=28.90 GFYU01049421.1:176-520(-)